LAEYSLYARITDWIGGIAMLLRLVVGAALFGFGYYLGREMGRTESIRETLRRFNHESRGEMEPVDQDDDSAVRDKGANGAQP
jgi:hypothetical protein